MQNIISHQQMFPLLGDTLDQWIRIKSEQIHSIRCIKFAFDFRDEMIKSFISIYLQDLNQFTSDGKVTNMLLSLNQSDYLINL